MNKHINLRTFTLIGLMANVSFILFIVLGLFYFWYWTNHGLTFTVGDVGIYPFEVIGFVLLLVSTSGYIFCIRGNKQFKILQAVYFFAELFLILLDFRILFPKADYNNENWYIIIPSLLFSIVVCLSFYNLNKVNRSYFIAVMVAVAIIPISFVALGLIFAFKVYFTILANCISYTFLYTYIYIKTGKEQLAFDARDYDSLYS